MLKLYKIDLIAKVKPEHHKYYLVEKNPEIDDIIKRFEPGEDDIEIKIGEEKSRMIFFNERNKYHQWELDRYDQFMEFLEEKEFEFFSDLDFVSGA